jgi:hypothetical protein
LEFSFLFFLFFIFYFFKAKNRSKCGGLDQRR